MTTMMRFFLSDVLAQLGYRCNPASSGRVEEAVQFGVVIVTDNWQRVCLIVRHTLYRHVLTVCSWLRWTVKWRTV